VIQLPYYNWQVNDGGVRYGIPPELVAAIIDVESNWEHWAINPEPRWRYYWDFRKKRPFRDVTQDEIACETPPDDFEGPLGTDPDAEWWAQQISFGLMQVMGAVGREMGYPGKWLDALLDPQNSIEYGCKYLSRLYRRYRSWDDAISAYNQGGPYKHGDRYINQEYVDKVYSALKKYKGEE